MPYNLNGRTEPQSRMQRLFRRSTEELTPDDPALVPVAESSDEAIASSRVLDAAPDFDPDAQSVLVHVLEVPADRVAEVLRLVGQDNYVRLPTPAASARDVVVVARVQRVDALHVSQERSRMAGVTARHGGQALLWRVLQVPA